MNAIGNEGDGIFFRRDLRPQISEDPRRYVAMDFGNPIVETRAAHGERGHVELARPRRQSQRQQLVAGNVQFATPVLEIIQQHLRGEIVVTGGHRGVSGEYGIHRNGFQRTGEVQALVNQVAQAFQ